MASITTLFIEGTIFPTEELKSCGMNSGSPTKSLLIKSGTQSKIFEDCVYLNDHFEKFFDRTTDPLFWKKRMMMRVVVSPHILSITFIPKNCKKLQTLFMQKINQEQQIQGFLAPYLPTEIQEKYHALSMLPPWHIIDGKETLSQSIHGVDETVYRDVKKILQFFLKDQETKSLVLTYRNETGGYTSEGWSKA